MIRCVRCNGFGIDHRNQNAGIGHLGGESAVATNNATDPGPDLFGILKRAHQVGTDSKLGIATADGKDEHRICRTQSAALYQFL